MILVEGGAWAFVPCFEEHLADLLVAERGGKVHVGVGEANRRGVGVVEERRVGFEDALHEQGIAGVDCASQSNRRLDHDGDGSGRHGMMGGFQESKRMLCRETQALAKVAEVRNWRRF